MQEPSGNTAVSSTPRFRFAFGCFIALFLLTGHLAINDLCIYTPDSTRYLVWAKSLASFQGFTDQTDPEPAKYVIHGPMYSVLLAPVARFFPLNIVAAKYLTLVLGALGLVLFCTWAAKRVNPWIALAGSFLLAFNPMYLLYTTEILSDVPFVVAFVLVLLLLDRMLRAGESTPLALLFLSIILMIAVLLREIGIALLVASVFYCWRKLGWKTAVFVASVPILFYTLWYIRDEVIVASAELPGLSNSRILTHHFFTGPAASLLEEFLARAGNNFLVYFKAIGSLLFFPFLDALPYDIVFVNSPPVSVVVGLLRVLQYPFIALTAGLVLYGIRHDYRTSDTAMLRIVFVVVYFTVIFLYPVNDVRFLLPIAVLMVYYGLLTAEKYIEQIPRRDNPSRWFRAVPYAVLVVAIVPNACWVAQYIQTNRSYMNSPEAFYETTKNMKRYPSHFTAPFPLAGEWICGHADSGAAILTQWKDLACWVQGRKVLNASNTITPDLFENKLRDYEVRYVVSVIQKNGVHEFEFQAEQSSRFAFMPVARFSNAVIFEVRRDDRRGADRDTGTFFRKGIFYLDRGKYDLAEKVLEEGREADSLNVLCYFFTTVAKEFNMKLGEASERFHQLESYPQSLQFLDEASVHQQIIGLLAEAALSTTAAEKSELYFRSGAGYWDLGYRARGLELIEMALAADSSFVPAYVFGIHFNLLRGDTLRARSLLKIAMNIPADKNVFVAWKNILSEIDSLHAVQSPARRAYHYGEISTAYSTMRIFDSAIESALQAARETPDGVESLYRLAKLYVAVNRFGPARRAYERLLSLEPGNTTMQREHEEILRRF